MNSLTLKILKIMMGGPHGADRPQWRKFLDARILQSMPGMISCGEFDQFLQDYLDDELSQKQLNRFDLHMTVCPTCKAHFETYLASYKLTREVFGQSQETVPDNVPEDLITAILDTTRSAKSAK